MFERAQAAELRRRLAEPRRFIQVLSGPRQVGKTTLARQVVGESSLPVVFASADEPGLRGSAWLEQQWDGARIRARAAQGGVLVLDEIQKAPGWSETVKRLWDEDTAVALPLRVVVLGSAPLLVQKGLTESLAGRFELLRLAHWSFGEMRAAFGFTLDDYLYFGGYPGAAALAPEPQRWASYVKDALIETTISRDVLLMTQVNKPALLRRLFELSCDYSGRILSYTKMLGQLQDAGNTTTLAHYLDLLEGAGLVMGISRFAGDQARQRGSSPKLLALNTALMTAQSGLSPEAARADREYYGRLVESAVGAHLANGAASGGWELSYWRDRNREVDFVTRIGPHLTAFEVKSSARRDALPGLDAFAAAFGPRRRLLVGPGGIPLDEFLAAPPELWVRP